MNFQFDTDGNNATLNPLRVPSKNAASATVELSGINKPTSLMVLCEEGRMEDVKNFIYNYNANAADTISLEEIINEPGNNKEGDPRTPLMVAVANEHSDIVEYLLEHGADTRTKNNRGSNAFHMAAFNVTDAYIMKILLEHLYSSISERNDDETLEDYINQKNKWDRTPLDFVHVRNIKFAEQNDVQTDMILLLQKYGGKSNAYNKVGKYVGDGNGDLNSS